ncbi:MAG: carboxypeptidase-like regulatory domain-containing protein [Cyclobacteriaceae bacterium]|nr:carboxypeptidase-like regulatory domain-containing protein [Cyclobacteriaceae bacterium]
MGRIILLIIFLFLSGVAVFGQRGSITGRILDASTLEPLPFSNIFVDQTTMGVAADDKGVYRMQNIPPGSYDFVFSYVGYQLYKTRQVIKSGEQLTLDIKLLPDEKQLAEVSVTTKRDKIWEGQRKEFEKAFFGQNKFSKSCKIINPWVLEFKTDKNLLSATSIQPLEIENWALGYRILYYLREFVVNQSVYKIAGQVRFEEINSTSTEFRESWIKERQNAYRGSYRHFFKSVIDSRLDDEGFLLYVDKQTDLSKTVRNSNFGAQLGKTIDRIDSKSIKVNQISEGRYSIQMPAKLEVHYSKERTPQRIYDDVYFPVSWLTVQGGTIEVDANGVLPTPARLIVTGQMNEGRVGALLPNNYKPIKNVALANSPESRLAFFEEKVYVHTDKPYYYPGEKIWWKAYMNYRHNEFMDSLSKVLYVELIDTLGITHHSQVSFIDNGFSFGALTLPETDGARVYLLRAYTNWMRNFGDNAVFIKPIQVLDIYEVPDVKQDKNDVMPSSELITTISKSTVKPREKIELNISLIDSDGHPMGGELSVSVTDMTQVYTVPEPKTILNSFEMAPLVTRPFKPTTTFPVEPGITISGIYRNAKGKPEKADLLAVQGKLKSFLPFSSDESGKFLLGHFQFYDSLEIAFQTANDKKTKGTIQLDKRDHPAITKSAPLSLFATKRKPEPQRQKLYYEPSEESTLLNDLIVKGSKIKAEEVVAGTSLISSADFSISEESILRYNATSAVDVLIGRVPGLTRVFDGQNYFLVFASSASFGSPATQEPLLVIDGIQIRGSTYSQISQLSPYFISKIEVTKYGGAAMYGVFGANGVISITTKHSSFVSADPTKAKEFDKSRFQMITVKGYSTPLKFDSPDYGTPNESHAFPDYRSTIYWAPSVKLDHASGKSTLSFYSADLETTYRIVVEGVTEDRKPVRSVLYVEIKE